MTMDNVVFNRQYPMHVLGSFDGHTTDTNDANMKNCLA